MNHHWQQVKLGDVLSHNDRAERVVTDKSYRLLGVRLAGQGPFLREEKTGAEIQASTLSPVEDGDFIYSRLFAWRGAFGLISSEYDGAHVSNEFPTFTVDRSRLESNYLRYYFAQAPIWSEVESFCTGTTKASRNRFKEEFFLRLPIPLPPLTEQRRIVARIEELSAKIEEARGLRTQAVEEAEAMLGALMHRFFAPGAYPAVKLESVCTAIIDNLHSNPVYADRGVACVRSPDVGWGRLKLATALCTSEEEYVRRTVRGVPVRDDIVLVREGGGTGKAAIVEDGQRFSLGQRVMMIRPDQKQVLSRYMLYHILSPAIYQDQILEFTKGSASPHLNIGALRKFRFYLPSLPEQRRIVTYLDNLQAKVDAVKKMQEETAKELTALMPSILSRAFSGEL